MREISPYQDETSIWNRIGRGWAGRASRIIGDTNGNSLPHTGQNNSQGASRPRLLFVAARTGPYFASVSERLPQPSLRLRMVGEDIGEKSLGE